MSFVEQKTRIDKLIRLITNSDTGTAEELARTLGVSRRTIFNDLEVLKIMGYQVMFCQTSLNYFLKKE
jgi:DeoR/GlpR family transcriptional regulator of sugar metabolism